MPSNRQRTRARGCALLTAILISLPIAAHAEASPFRVSADGGLGYDGNVANAESGPQMPATGFAVADVNAQYKHRLPMNTELVLRGTLGGEQYFHYVGLSSARATGLARLYYRPSGGFYAPTFSIWGSAAQSRFGSRMRDSSEYRGGAFVSEQLTTELSARLGGTFSERDSDSRVFDLRGRSASLNLDWLVTHALTAYLGYEYRYGDVFSSGQPTLKIVQAAKVIEIDDAFGGEAANEFAYRFTGHSQIGTLGLNYSFSPRFSVDLQGQNINTRAGYGNHYNHPVGVISLLTRF
jgi:hypothetical protein